MCDNCLTVEPEELIDLTIPAQMFLSCVLRTRELFGAAHIISVLRGSRAQKVLKFGHEQLSTYGIGRDYSAKQWSAMVQEFIQQGLLERDQKHGSLKLTQEGRAVLGGQKVMGMAPEIERVRDRAWSEVPDYDQALFELLRGKRKELADGGGVPPFVVFSDRSLAEMAAHYPQSEQSFFSMYGVGRRKVEKYADHFLPIIRAYCRENNLAERPKLRIGRARSLRGGRTLTVGQAYQSGGSIRELVSEFGVKPRTILNHLLKFVQSGNSIPPGDILDLSALTADERAQVLAAFEEHGPDYLRPVFDALNGKVSFDELHVMRLYFLATREERQEQARG